MRKGIISFVVAMALLGVVSCQADSLSRSGEKPAGNISANLLAIQPVEYHRTSSNPMIHAQGTRIVDGEGRPIKLRGVLLEGWLMWNGPLWGAGLASETRIAKRLEQMAGAKQTEQFREAIYDGFITEQDIRMIAEMGFNVVRVPFNHTVLEDENLLEAYTASGWYYLDRLLDWCDRQGVYVVLDLHSVPGGQGRLFVSDPDLKHVWRSPSDQRRTVEIWTAIAARYRNHPMVAGYDLINEPDPPRGKELVDLYHRIIAGIRSVDPNHMVILEGDQFASNDFSMFKAPLDANQVYSFHTYNLFTDATGESHLRKLAKMAEEQNVPLWNGEFGAHKATWINDVVQLFEDPKNHVNGWIFWPWKRVAEANQNRYRTLAQIVPGPDWKRVAGGIAALFGPDPKITPEIAKHAIDDFLEAMKAKNLVVDDQMQRILMPEPGKPPEKVLNGTGNTTSQPSGLKPDKQDQFVRKLEAPASRTSQVKKVTVLRGRGGRVSWNKKNNLIAFDMKGKDGLYDIYVMNPDGSGERCLTCGKIGLLPQKNNGQPEWHPSGEYIVFQAEMANNPRSSSRAQPGLGVFQDLWLMDKEGKHFWPLTMLPATGDNGVLHPHFSHDGKTLTWSQLYKGGNPLKPKGLLGYWKLKVADFAIGPKGPVLSNTNEYQPGGPAFYENHGLSPDGRYLLYTSNCEATKILQLSANDIYRYDLWQNEVTKLTEGSYNEVAHWSPNGQKAIWMSSQDNRNKGTDYWMMDPDGSNKIRLTRFNDSRHPVSKAAMFCADFAWSPESDRIAAYVQTSLVTQDGILIMIDLDDATVQKIKSGH